MSSLAIVASLLVAASNDPSGMDKAEHAVMAPLADEIGHGPVIELDVFTLSAGPTTNSRFNILGSSGSQGTPLLLVFPGVHVGWEFDQNAILVGAQLWFVQGANGNSGQTEVSVPITFRHYMKALQAYTFNPFVEGRFSMDFLQAGGNNSSLQFGFGIDLGFGGEYLFTRNFGLMGKVLLGYQHVPATFASANGQDTNAVGIGGVLGILVHF